MIELELILGFAGFFLFITGKENFCRLIPFCKYIVIFLFQSQFYDNCISSVSGASPLLLNY